MGDFSNYKKFENVGIRSSNDTLIVMDSTNNNISLHSSDGGGDNVDTLSIKNIINKTPNMDLNLSSLNGTTINPVITINNNNQDCRINTNLNVSGNVNITDGGMIKTTGIGSFGSINCGVGTFTSIDSGSGEITTTGIGSFGTVTANTFSGTLSGNAATATILATTRTIGGVDFNGSADINLPGVNAPGTQDTTGTAATATELATARSIGGVSFDGTTNINLPGVNTPGTQNTIGTAEYANNAGRLSGKYWSEFAPVTHYHNYATPGSSVNFAYMGLGGAGASSSYGLIVSTNHSYNTQGGGTKGYIYWSSSYNFSGTPGNLDSSYVRDGTVAKFNGGIWITGNYAILFSSDSRIKKNIVDVPDNLALQQLRNIPCRYYEYIDKLERGTDKTIGFIAQEVKSVLPMAVSQKKQIIPNVYKLINCTWTSNADKFIMSSTDLPNVNGIVYKFYVSNATDASDEKEIEITGNSDNTFTFDAPYTNVFCYGSEVDDFHTVDKQKLFTINFSATQEIDKIQQTHITEIASLKAENQQQQTKINTLETEVSTLKTENAELKSIIDKLKTANSFEEFKQTF